MLLWQLFVYFYEAGGLIYKTQFLANELDHEMSGDMN